VEARSIREHASAAAVSERIGKRGADQAAYTALVNGAVCVILLSPAA